MKQVLKPAITALLCVLLFAPTAARAQGSVHGGGDALFRDGQWLLKDLFVRDYFVGQSMDLGDELRTKIRSEVAPLIDLYAGVNGSLYWNEVLGDHVDLRLVDRLPCRDDTNDAQIQYACTVDGVSYFHAERMKQLPAQQRFLALLHQRAHAFDPRPDAHDWIEPFIQGVWLLLKIQAEQESRYRELEAREVAAIHLENIPRVQSVLLRGAQGPIPIDRHVLRRGGGILISTASPAEAARAIDAGSFVGIGSVLSLAACEPDAPIVFPAVRGMSIIARSRIECAEVDASQVSDTRIERRNLGKLYPELKKSIGGAARITHSHLTYTRVASWSPTDFDRTVLEDVILRSASRQRNYVQNARLSHSVLESRDLRTSTGEPDPAPVRIGVQ